MPGSGSAAAARRCSRQLRLGDVPGAEAKFVRELVVAGELRSAGNMAV
jgi:hypothetical protein